MSLLQKGVGCQAGRQKESVAQYSLPTHAPLPSQSGKQRASTQCSPEMQSLLEVHSAVARQKPLWQVWPAAQSPSPPQMAVQPLSTQAREELAVPEHS